MEEVLAVPLTFARSPHTVELPGRQGKLHLRHLKLSRALKLEMHSGHFPPTAISGLRGRSQEVDVIEVNVTWCVLRLEDDPNA
jgi:hypothetical protein